MQSNEIEEGGHIRRVNVRVITTAGSYPRHGHEQVPADEQVSAILGRAAHALGIADTTQWVAKIAGNEIDPSKTYVDLGINGEVKIDYGKREGGGGHAPTLGEDPIS